MPHWAPSYHLRTGPSSKTLVQAITSSLCPAVTSVINASLASGTFPSTFNQARVMPLLKKSSLNPTQMENHRLASLLLFLSKGIEQAVFKRQSVSLALTQHKLCFKDFCLI